MESQAWIWAHQGSRELSEIPYCLRLPVNSYCDFTKGAAVEFTPLPPHLHLCKLFLICIRMPASSKFTRLLWPLFSNPHKTCPFAYILLMPLDVKRCSNQHECRGTMSRKKHEPSKEDLPLLQFMSIFLLTWQLGHYRQHGSAAEVLLWPNVMSFCLFLECCTLK